MPFSFLRMEILGINGGKFLIRSWVVQAQDVCGATASLYREHVAIQCKSEEALSWNLADSCDTCWEGDIQDP